MLLLFYCTSALINTVTAYCARFPEMNYYIVLTSFIPRQVVYKRASLKDRNSEPYLFKTISVLQIQKKNYGKKSNIVILTSLCHVDDIAAPPFI